jgi:hypothetical protein
MKLDVAAPARCACRASYFDLRSSVGWHQLELIAWLAASPPEFVLTEGIVLPIEEGLP